jgi:D-threo-aldose 1-dehydrogenase
LRCNYIDTAPLYGESETLLGGALAGETRPFYLPTKVGFKPDGFDYRSDSVLRSLERSLGLLGRSKLTVAQIHEVNLAGWERIMEPGGTLAGLREAQKRGLCDYVGITSRALPILAELAATGEFDTMPCYHDYHPCVQLAAEQVLPAAAKSDMGVVMATVLGGGIYVEDERQEEAVEKWYEGEEEQRRVCAIIEKMRKEDSTLPQSDIRRPARNRRDSFIGQDPAKSALRQS